MALDAKTGKTVKTFGDNGMVDLGDGSGHIAFLWSSPGPLVVKDVIVVGGQSVRNEAEYEDVNLPGDVRGFDVHTGKLLWTFHTIPRDGEFGAETWLNESAKTNGKAKVWSLLSADEELGYVYAPLSAAANDWYGGRRPARISFRTAWSASTQDRQAGLALSTGSSRSVGLRSSHRADSRRSQRGWKKDQGRGAGDQDGLRVRVRPRDGEAHLAH